MHRGERLAWLVAGLVTATLVLMAATILFLDYWGARRVEECREGLPPQGDAWEACSELTVLDAAWRIARGDFWPLLATPVSLLFCFWIGAGAWGETREVAPEGPVDQRT